MNKEEINLIQITRDIIEADIHNKKHSFSLLKVYRGLNYLLTEGSIKNKNLKEYYQTLEEGFYE